MAAQEPEQLEASLMQAGLADDGHFDAVRAALLLAALDRPDVSLQPYEEHLAELGAAARGFLKKVTDLPVNLAASALADLVADRFGYHGDEQTYDDMQNANLMRVIDRRRGLPVSLGLIYLHAARALGLDLSGLDFPGHFVMRLQGRGGMAIMDPFNRGRTLDARDLLELLRRANGNDAKLTPDTYVPVSDRDVVLRLQNNILGRALGAGDPARACTVLSRMIMIAPAKPELRFELGRLEVHAGHLSAAAEAFTACIGLCHEQENVRMSAMAADALIRLKARLH